MEVALEVDRQISEDSASLRALIDTIVDGVVIIDSRGAIRVFNPASERLFGYRADEIIGQNDSALMPEPFRSEHDRRSEEHTSELQSLMRISYAVFCLNKQT